MVSRTIPPTTLSPCSEKALACDNAVCSAAMQRKITVWMRAMMGRLRLFRMENECMTCFFIQLCTEAKNPAVTEVTESSWQNRGKTGREFTRINADGYGAKKATAERADNGEQNGRTSDREGRPDGGGPFNSRSPGPQRRRGEKHLRVAG